MIKAKVGNNHEFEIETKGGITLVNGKTMNADALLLKNGTQHWLVNNRSFRVEIEEVNRTEKKYHIRVNGKSFHVELKERLDDLLHEMGMDSKSSQKINDLYAPMPGLVVDILVKEGQSIKKGDTIIILEAMKMENSLKAMTDATVKKIVVAIGAAVDKNAVLVQMA